VQGAFTFQDADAPDEFADTEAPADYSVNVLMVPLGALVTWTNHDEAQVHTVTAVDGSFDSGFMTTGASFSHTFDTPGEFEYFCGPHPWMRAKIMVEMH
jgi:plastocyanin